LSYIREDKASVDQLQQVLEAAGIPIWRDIRDLQPGQDWKLSIRRAISEDALERRSSNGIRLCRSTG